MSWYTTGTINVTKNSKIVKGINTQWTNPLLGVSAGRMLIIQTLTVFEIYEIESIQSDTQLILSEEYVGTTEAGKIYKIPTTPTVSIEQLALEISATLGYYQKQLESWQAILTGDGEVTLTAPNGQIVTIKSQYAISKELISIVEAAKESASQASTFASNASKSATSAKTSETNSKNSATQAVTSATSAALSETNAAVSAKSAKNSETNSKTSETSAAKSALEAKSAASSLDTSTFIKKSGDTMTNALTINTDGSGIQFINSAGYKWVTRIHADNSYSLSAWDEDSSSWKFKFRYVGSLNVWRFDDVKDVTINGSSVLKQGDGGLFSKAPVLAVNTDLLTDAVLSASQTFTLSGAYINSPVDGLSFTGTLKVTRRYYDAGAAATLEISHANNAFYKATAYKANGVWKTYGWVEQANTSQSYSWEAKQTFKGGIELNGDETSSWVDIGKSKSNGNRYLSFYFYDNPASMTGPWTSGLAGTNDGNLWLNPKSYSNSVATASRFVRSPDHISNASGGTDCFIARDKGSNVAAGSESNGGIFSSQWSTENVYAKFYLAQVINNYTEARIAVNNWNTNSYKTIALRDNGHCYNYSGSFINASDKRLKENFKPLEGSLEKVLALNPVYYNRIDNEDKTVELGVIAQEVKQIIPEASQLNAKTVKMADGTELEDVLGVDYGALTVAAIGAIKELNAIVKKQSNAINQLEKEIKELKRNDN